jgi:hypothetical protein
MRGFLTVKITDGNGVKKTISKLRGEQSTTIPLTTREFHWTSFLGGFVICVFLFVGVFYALEHRYKIITTPVVAIQNAGFTGFRPFQPFKTFQAPKPPHLPQLPRLPQIRTFGQMPAPATSQTIRIDTWTGKAWIYDNSSGTWQVFTNVPKKVD